MEAFIERVGAACPRQLGFSPASYLHISGVVALAVLADELAKDLFAWEKPEADQPPLHVVPQVARYTSRRKKYQEVACIYLLIYLDVVVLLPKYIIISAFLSVTHLTLSTP